MKKLISLALLLCVSLSLVACGGGSGSTDTTGNGGIPENEWEEMLSASNFGNYTLTMEGTMTVTQNGEIAAENQKTKQVLKVTADKLELTLYFFDDEINEFVAMEPAILEGELAQSQKEQSAQVYLALLAKRDSYIFDAATDSYKVTETVTFEAVLDALSYDENGNEMTFEVPTTIEMREATLKLSEDGKLLSFTADYTQTMEMGVTTVTAGITTWSFSDYGTTVIG